MLSAVTSGSARPAPTRGFPPDRKHLMTNMTSKQPRHRLSSNQVSDRRRFRPSLELLEDRSLLSTFTVTNTADAGPGSFRQALLDANALAGLDTVAFSIGSGVQTIRPNSALPTITDPLVIDGTTQPGF